MSTDQLTGLLRLVGGMVSGYLVNKGMVDADMASWAGAGIIALLTGVWSWWSNKPGKTIAAI